MSIIPQDGPGSELVRDLLAGPVVSELHHLLWSKPRLNKGMFDPGWSCREHAVSVATLLTLDGGAASICHGKAVLIQGETETGPPVGIGQERYHSGGHSWVRLRGFGDIDLSPRTDTRMANWRPVRPSLGVIGTQWPVEGLLTHVAFCESGDEFEREVAVASNRSGQGTAVYWPRREATFTPEMLTNGVEYINSPITKRVVELAGVRCYVRLVCHLRGLIKGDRPSLATKSWAKAWSRIGDIEDGESDALVASLSG